MGKYGCGVSMKSVIEMKYTDVKAVLEKYKMAEEDKKTVLDTLKEMAYQWCQSNAFARAKEKCEKNKGVSFHIFPPKDYLDEFGKVMEETYPWWNEEEE